MSIFNYIHIQLTPPPAPPPPPPGLPIDSEVHLLMVIGLMYGILKMMPKELTKIIYAKTVSFIKQLAYTFVFHLLFYFRRKGKSKREQSYKKYLSQVKFLYKL